MGRIWSRFSLYLFQMFNLWKGNSRIIMACHTWIYKKVKEIPTKEIKTDVLNAIAQIEASGKYSDEGREKWENVLEREAHRLLDRFEKLKSEDGTTQKSIDDFVKKYGYIIAYADKFHREMK